MSGATVLRLISAARFKGTDAEACFCPSDKKIPTATASFKKHLLRKYVRIIQVKFITNAKQLIIVNSSAPFDDSMIIM